MSAQELIFQIKEDYLTCSICFLGFSKPKALPCLHTFCESCLREYIESKGYQTAAGFPCPICRTNAVMPAAGVAGFPDNHLMASLSETVDRSTSRPVPKPRRSLGKGYVEGEISQGPRTSTGADREVGTNTDAVGNSRKDSWSQVSLPSQPSPLEATLSDYLETTRTGGGECALVNHGLTHLPQLGCLTLSDQGDSLSPSPQDASLTSVPQGDSLTSSPECDNLTSVPQADSCTPVSLGGHFPKLTAPLQTTTYPEVNETDVWTNTAHMFDPPPPYYPPLSTITASLPAYSPLNMHLPSSTTTRITYPSSVSDSTHSFANPNLQDHTDSHQRTNSNRSMETPTASYPTLQTQPDTELAACTENLLLKFGKQGVSVRDFTKPFGLAVSKDGSYIISDSSGDQNKIFIFNNRGELTTAFNCGCKVKDLTVTKEDEILVAVHKNVCAIRHFTMAGKLKAEYGKFFTFEEPSGIGKLTNGGVVLSGTQNHCVYVLTDQIKLAHKFGRKGKGEGYFQYPGYLAVDSKNHIIVTDKVNNSVQVFTTDGKLRQHFGTTGVDHGQLQSPLGVCVDDSDNIIVADSGNNRVEIFSPKGRWLKSVVTNTQELGDKVKPVNVAVTPTGHVAVLLRGPYFSEVRVYASKHKHLMQKEWSVIGGASTRGSK